MSSEDDFALDTSRHRAENRHDLVKKVVEFGHCSVNEAKVALFDNENFADEAITAILDRKLSSEIQKKYSAADSHPDVPGPSTSRAISNATWTTAYQAKKQKIESEVKLDDSYFEKFMIDRIIQFYLAEFDNAIPLTRYFDTKWNQDFRNRSSIVPLKGGKPYHKPYGCMRYSISVIGKYPPNDHWLGGGGPEEEEWPVAYHGTKEVNVLDILVNGFKLEKGIRFAFGKGIYCTPDPKVALTYANDYQFQDKHFKLILQCRVDPTRLQIVVERQMAGEGAYWLVPEEKSIRPYAICVYEQEAATKIMTGQLGAVGWQPYATAFSQNQMAGPHSSSTLPRTLGSQQKSGSSSSGIRPCWKNSSTTETAANKSNHTKDISGIRPRGLGYSPEKKPGCSNIIPRNQLSTGNTTTTMNAEENEESDLSDSNTSDQQQFS